MIKKHIAVIDDDVSIGEALMSILEEANYKVNTFTSGRKILEGNFPFPFNLILLDYVLPGEVASEVVKGLRSKVRDIPIVLMSANKEAKDEARKLLLNAFISKPFYREKILEVIEDNIS